MNSLAHLIRLAAQRAGVDLVRYPDNDPLWRIVQLLRHKHLSTVIDVGANNGGYAKGLRQHGFSGRIMSFEPLNDPFQELRTVSLVDPLWDVVQCAIGDENRMVTLNVAGNDGASSSVLPMLDRHIAAAPQASYVSVEEARQYSLDEIVPQMLGNIQDELYLKVDVQGYERAVLAGASNLLKSGQISGLQLELSFVPLYEGGMTWEEGFQHASDLGMTLMALDPGFRDPQNGQTLQADAVFFRDQG
jgi:FkbM family methyltransferase